MIKTSLFARFLGIGCIIGAIIPSIDCIPEIGTSLNEEEILTPAGSASEPKSKRSVGSDSGKSKSRRRSMGCPGVVCSLPPSDAICQASTTADVNPLVPVLGSKSDCCPVHTCKRQDGSEYTHYGMQGDGSTGTSSSYASGTGINNFPTPSLPEGFGNFGSLPSFDHKPLKFPSLPKMPSHFGSNDNKRYNRDVSLQPQFQAAFPQWDIYRVRRDLGAQYVRPEFYLPLQRPAAFPRF